MDICFTVSTSDDTEIFGTRGSNPKPYSLFKADPCKIGPVEQYNSRSVFNSVARDCASEGDKKSSHGFAELTMKTFY